MHGALRSTSCPEAGNRYFHRFYVQFTRARVARTVTGTSSIRGMITGSNEVWYSYCNLQPVFWLCYHSLALRYPNTPTWNARFRRLPVECDAALTSTEYK